MEIAYTASRRHRRIVLVLLLGFLVLVASGCEGGVKASDVATVKANAVRAYPGWKVERVYSHYSGGFGNGEEMVVVLKWPRPEDFAIRLSFTYNGLPSGSEPSPSLFRNQNDAADFISAFKAQHREPGLVVSDLAFLSPAAVRDAGPSGKTEDFPYWTLAALDSSNGGISHDFNGLVDTWHATVAGSAISWHYLSTR